MLSKWIPAIIAAVVSAYAAAVVAQYATPIDSALPLIVVIVTIVAALSHPAIQVAVPLLIGGEIAIADERLRLLWFGTVIGAAFAAATLCHPDPERQRRGGTRAVVVAVSAIVLLRWIPLKTVVIWREVLLIAIVLLILAALRGTAAGVALAVAVALFTPLIPLRTIGFPLAVLVVVVVLRAFDFPVLHFDVAASLSLALMLTFFAWSGVFARATSFAIRGLPSATPREPIRMALAPGQSVNLDVPADANAVILSGANISRLRPGTIAGSINNVPIRIGDVADWGFLRREYFYGSRNRVPNDPAGELRDYGQNAWIDGAARFPIRKDRSLHIAADPHLPATARLQIDAFEVVNR